MKHGVVAFLYQKCTTFHMDKNLELVSVDPFAPGITWISKDQGVDATSVGHPLLELGSRHQLIIYMCLAQRSVLKEFYMLLVWRR